MTYTKSIGVKLKFKRKSKTGKSKDQTKGFNKLIKIVR